MVDLSGYEVAAIVPCFNEEVAIPRVVADLKRAVPGITVYVYDNNSSDDTSRVAAEAGAIVRFEPRKGKGNVVRRAFADIEADIYLMIDGDDTYDASAAPGMINTLIEENLDHVLGCRADNKEDSAYRPGHAQGNAMFNRLVSWLFKDRVSDMLSGYRIFSRRFVKAFPALSKEFEIETELTVFSMALRVPQKEVSVGFKDRPAGSDSKLRTFRDGFHILGTVVRLLAHERPWLFYGFISCVLFLLSLILGIPVIWEFAKTGLVPRLPTAVLSSSLVLIGVLSLVVATLQAGLLRARQEAMRLSYLRIPGIEQR